MRAFGCYVTRSLAAGRHRRAALVAREVVGLRRACEMRRDRSGTLRFSATVHDRRSRSSLRRSLQEVAASLNHGGGRNATRSGATVGESRPSARNKKAFPGGEGVTA